MGGGGRDTRTSALAHCAACTRVMRPPGQPGWGGTETSSPAAATCCVEPPFTHGKGSAAQPCPTLCDPTDCSHQAPLPTGFSRRGYWTGLSFPSPGDLPEPHIDASRYFYLPGRQSGELKDTGRETRLPGFESRFGKTRERVPWSRLLSPSVLRAWPLTL